MYDQKVLKILLQKDQIKIPLLFALWSEAVLLPLSLSQNPLPRDKLTSTSGPWFM